MNTTHRLLISLFLALLTLANAQLTPTPLAVEVPTPTPIATPTPVSTSDSTSTNATPTPVSASDSTSAPFLDNSEPIEAMLPDNSLIEEPGAVEMVESIREEVMENGRCNPNVCFAIDGGKFVSDADFKRQIEFVQLVSAIVGVDTRSQFAAVQYTSPLRPISRLTRDTDQFLLDIDATVQRRSFTSRVRPALRFCIRELTGNEEDVNKIVVLADGRSVFRGRVARLSRNFRSRSPGNSICAVGIGFGRERRLLKSLAGQRSRILTINQYFELLDIIDALVAEICDF